jgi:CRISPR-associated protein Cas4
MEPYIQISKLNDYLFCPRSIYLHGVYEQYSTRTYHDKPQTAGRLAHEPIDTGSYSTRKQFLYAMPIYSQALGVAGKIDMYDSETKTLIERKKKVVKIYDGYLLQLHAQYLCMVEMGYQIDHLQIRSLEDKKTYEVGLPTKEQKEGLQRIIQEMIQKSVKDFPILYGSAKCERCIYRPLCH